jgi:disulfide bond formation protein DsbB
VDDVIQTLIHVASFVAGAAGIVLVLGAFTPSTRSVVARLTGGNELWFAFACALLMTLSSLYLSEVLHYLPCRLCWYQRICAYPLAVVLGWAAFRRDRNAWAPALTLALVGIGVSTYHILLDTGVVTDTGSCDPNNPCTLRWPYAGTGTGYWYLTIQVGAFCCFLFIIGMALHGLFRSTDPEPAPEA